MELLVRRYGGETSSSALDTAAAPLPPPPKKPRTSAAAAAADSSGAAGAPILKQLAPRGRGRSNAAGSSSKGAAAAAAGTGNNSTSVGGSAAGGGGGSSSNKLTDHTPRPQDLGSMLAAEHDYAPREGELVGLGDSDEPIIEPGRHFMSGTNEKLPVKCGFSVQSNQLPWLLTCHVRFVLLKCSGSSLLMTVRII